AADPWFALSSIRLKKYDPLILVFGQAFPEGLERKKLWQQVNKLTETTPVVVVNLGGAARMAELPASVTLIQGNDTGVMGQSVVAQMIAGGIPITGKFPLALSERLFVGAESQTQKIRLAYGPAESVGLDSRILARIDSIAWEGISELAMPGAQILVAKNGRVIYNQSHGYHTYLKRRGVYPTDLYDIASMTKIMGTTLAAMSMYDQGKLELDVPIRKYFRDPYIWQDSVAWSDTLYVGVDSSQLSLSDTVLLDPRVLISTAASDTTFLPGDSILVIRHVSEGRIRRPSPVLEPTIAELMTHTSGLPAGINIRELYRAKTTWKKNKQYFSQRSDSAFSIPVARDLYLRTDMADSIWATTLMMNRRDSTGYKYSDANMILVQRVIDSLNRESLDRYLDRTWYSPLGLQHTTFRAADSYGLDRLIPTEHDQRYRGQTLQGYVHDPTAALMGGVSGNAGLFSTAEDLAIIGQMWLQQGRYGGQQWLKPQTVDLFTKRQGGHRGLGFDKPPYEGDYLIAPSASPNSFGHTGFTGTLIWMDPDEDLVFIFLSNRVHPRANNWLLNQMSIRQRAHEVVYEAIRESKKNQGMIALVNE
ncbi:MAG: serine hydrolase, partial [Bacteroidia bacterium]|nr:serine hydrolase [Bacteroidia bacterium]